MEVQLSPVVPPHRLPLLPHLAPHRHKLPLRLPEGRGMGKLLSHLFLGLC